MALHHYLPQDRLRALAEQRSLPARTWGTALFADISGFTALTESLTHALGERRGVEALTRTVGRVYDALIHAVEAQGGSTLTFAGDATLCWFDAAEGGADGEGDANARRVRAAQRAVQAALAMQSAMQAVNRELDVGARPLALKVSVASGPARRFTVGDAAIQTIDVLAGPVVLRVAAADAEAQAGDVLLDEATALAVAASVLAWRGPAAARVAVVDPAWAGPCASLPPVAALQAVPEVPAERLRPWVLPFVFERELAGEGLFVTDLRPVVALFLRFDGLENAQGDIDDAAVQRLGSWIGSAQRILHDHGGVLLELILGDKGSYLYAAFGAAVAHEDDACRALHAALALRAVFGGTAVDAAEAANGANAVAAPDTPLVPPAAAARIGVASGTLRVGGYGARNRQSFGAQGDAVNAAARLMTLARPGEILTSGRVRSAVAQEFALQPRPPIALKGKAEPMPVFALLGPQRLRARRLQATDFVLPMVGRDDALQALAQQLHTVAQGRGAFVCVQAEAGMGKSRLLAEAVRLALRQGFVGFGGGATGAGSRAPYRLWHGVWTALLDLDPALSPRMLPRAVEAAAIRCAGERAEAWPLLGPALGLELAHNTFTQALAPRDRKALLEALLLEALRQAAEDAAQDGAGVLLLLKDVHDADPLSLELLAAVVRASAALPVMVLASQRPREGADWPDVAALVAPAGALQGVARLTTVCRIELDALDAVQAEQLIRAHLAARFPERTAPVPETLIARVVERAQGNPLYIEELLKHLCERGLDPHRDNTWQALDWPVGLRSLVLSRIDRLDMPAQLALKRASVIGSHFSAADLQDSPAAAGSLEALRATLMRLCEAGLVQRADRPGGGGCRIEGSDPADVPARDPPGHAAGDATQEACGDAAAADTDPRFNFRHRVTLEVTYESIGQASRVRLHAQVARRLEAVRAGQAPGAPPPAHAPARALAHHWAQAERTDLAWPYRLEAAEQAAARYANDESLESYTQVLAWLPASEPGTRAEVLLRREALLRLLGRHDERRRDLAELDTLVARMDDAAGAASWQRRLALRRAALELDVGHFADAALHAQAVLDRPAPAEGAGPADPAHEVEALLLLARVRFAGGQAEPARELLDQAAARAKAHGLPEQAANATVQLGLVEWQLGHYDAAEALLQFALPAIRAQGALRAELDLLNNLGVVAKSRAHFAQAVARYEQARAIARRIGDRSGEAMLLNNMASASLAAGDFYRAAQDSERAARIWAELNEASQLGAAWINRAEAHRELGQHGLAQTLGEQALVLLRHRGQRRFEAIVLENLGRVALARGDAAGAGGLLQAALVLAREIGLRAIEASTLFDLGRLHTAQGEFGPAEAALDEAGRLMVELGDPVGLADVQTARADLWLRDSRRPPQERASAARAQVAESLPSLWAGAGGTADIRTELPADAGATLQPAQPLRPMAQYLVAWRVLVACGDAAADDFRARALAELRGRAARIPDPHVRHDFLQLPEHRALLSRATGTGTGNGNGNG
jgi:adenylate cyclase